MSGSRNYNFGGTQLENSKICKARNIEDTNILNRTQVSKTRNNFSPKSELFKLASREGPTLLFWQCFAF